MRKVKTNMDIKSRLGKRLIPLSDEDAKLKHTAELPLALAMVESALAYLLPGEIVKVVDGSIEGCNGSVTLNPVVYEVPRIGAIQDTAGWQVHVVHYHHATNIHPEEYEPVKVGTASYWKNAVKFFVETILKQKAYDYWEHLSESEMAQEYFE